MWDAEGGLPFAGSLIMISVDIVLYLSLAFYLDNVVPGKNIKRCYIFWTKCIMILWKWIVYLVCYSTLEKGSLFALYNLLSSLYLLHRSKLIIGN